MVSVDEFKKMLKDAEMDAAREFDKPKDILDIIQKSQLIDG